MSLLDLDEWNVIVAVVADHDDFVVDTCSLLFDSKTNIKHSLRIMTIHVLNSYKVESENLKICIIIV